MNDSPPSYPQRGPSFLPQLTRLLFNDAFCVGTQMGGDSMLMVLVIANAEERQGYRAAVTVSNGTLSQIVGIATWERLDKVRAKAIKNGWLHYDSPPSGSREAGRYWVTVPQELADLVPDADTVSFAAAR